MFIMIFYLRSVAKVKLAPNESFWNDVQKRQLLFWQLFTGPELKRGAIAVHFEMTWLELQVPTRLRLTGISRNIHKLISFYIFLILCRGGVLSCNSSTTATLEYNSSGEIFSC